MTAANLLRVLLKAAARFNRTALPEINPDAAVLFGAALAVALSLYFGV